MRHPVNIQEFRGGYSGGLAYTDIDGWTISLVRGNSVENSSVRGVIVKLENLRLTTHDEHFCELAYRVVNTKGADGREELVNESWRRAAMYFVERPFSLEQALEDLYCAGFRDGRRDKELEIQGALGILGISTKEGV